MTTPSKRYVAAIATFACALSLVATQCTAQDFPSRLTGFVVPYGAGGSPDVIARIIGQRFGEVGDVVTTIKLS